MIRQRLFNGKIVYLVGRSRTCLGEQQVNLIGQELGDSGVEMINGLLHGLYAHTQVVVFPLQHGVLLEQVAEALGAVLPKHSLPLQRGRGERTGRK